LIAVAFFGGWVARVDYMQFKADQEREERATENRQAYENEFIKQINRNNLFNSWVTEVKSEVKK
jgi:hypothetical protein